MLTLVSKDSVKNSDHFDVLCVLIACMVLEIINQNQMSKNQKSSLIVWNTVLHSGKVPVNAELRLLKREKRGTEVQRYATLNEVIKI